jgi:hypothetical protein
MSPTGSKFYSARQYRGVLRIHENQWRLRVSDERCRDDRKKNRPSYHLQRSAISEQSWPLSYVLIKPETGGWTYDENDRPASYRHKDWLWRISDHDGLSKTAFDCTHKTAYQQCWFAKPDVDLAENYVLFSSAPDETYIAQRPPQIATAKNGKHERWTDSALKRLTIDKAATLHRNQRAHLRNTGFGYSHPVLRFKLRVSEAVSWRKSLIVALRSKGA